MPSSTVTSSAGMISCSSAVVLICFTVTPTGARLHRVLTATVFVAEGVPVLHAPVASF